MKYILLLLLSFIIFAPTVSFGQSCMDVTFDPDGDKYIKNKKAINKLIDYNFYYFSFEETFRNDHLVLSFNDSLIFSGYLNTDPAMGIAKVIKLEVRDIDKVVRLIINKTNYISLYLNDKKCLRVRYDKRNNSLKVWCSTYLPQYD